MVAANKEFLIQVKADIDKAVADMHRLHAAIVKQGKGSKSAADNTRSQSNAIQRLAAAAGTYLSIASAIKALRIADEYQVLDQRIRTATKSTGDYVRVSQEVYAISQRNGTVLKDTVSTFQSLSRSASELGASNTEILKVTEAVQQLGIISGASQGAMSAGLLQFSQGLAAGVFRAEEMNSIIENMPEVANRIAKGMNMTVGELRRAVIEGRILSRDVFESLLTQAPGIATEMANIPDSLARSLQKLDTSTAKTLSSLEQKLKLIKENATFMDHLTRAIDDANSWSEFLWGMGISGLAAREAQQRRAAERRSWEALQEQVGKYRKELADVDAQIEKTSGKLLEMDPVNTTDEHDQLGRDLEGLRKRQQELNKSIEETERNYRKMGSAFGQGTRLSAAEQKKLANSMEVVKKSLIEQIYLFGKQAKALSDAKQQAQDFESAVTGASARLNKAYAGESSLGKADIQAQLRKARTALEGGDSQAAVQEAEKALDLIAKVGEGGKESEAILKYFMRLAAQIGREASTGLVDTQQAAFEQVKTTITDLLAEAEKLKSLQVNFDQEKASLNAEFLRATLQEEFNNNPLELPVILRKPKTGAVKLVEQALEKLPAQAGGGLVRGPGSGTSDEVLMWGSNGEYMMRAAAVRHYGPDFLNRLNRMQLPRFADGGLVSRSLPQFNFSPPPVTSGRPVYLDLNGQQYPVTADHDTADRLERDISRAALKKGGRK